jgi:hypothetical protein
VPPQAFWSGYRPATTARTDKRSLGFLLPAEMRIKVWRLAANSLFKSSAVRFIRIRVVTANSSYTLLRDD